METRITALFRIGDSQAVHLPKEYRFEGSLVSIRREGRAVVLEPVQEVIDSPEGKALAHTTSAHPREECRRSESAEY